MASVANVSELINQLIGLSHTKSENEKELICQCSIGKLRINTDSENEYMTAEQCNKGFVCYYVATEKHLAGKLSHGLNLKIDNKFVSNNKDIHIKIELDSVNSIFL